VSAPHWKFLSISTVRRPGETKPVTLNIVSKAGTTRSVPLSRRAVAEIAEQLTRELVRVVGDLLDSEQGGGS
jgi:hypothetical protein